MKYSMHLVPARRGSTFLKFVTLFLFLVLLPCLTGCENKRLKEAQALANSGSATAEKISNYYGGLIEKNQDYLKLYGYNLSSGCGESAVSEKLAKEYKTQNVALAHRKDLAQKLKSLYDSLAKLADYDASGEVKDAMEGLVTAIGKQVKLSGSSIEPKTLLGQAAQVLTQAMQLRRFDERSLDIVAVLDGISGIFEEERPVYVQIANRYINETYYLSKHFACPPSGGQRAQMASFFEKHLAPYGLTIYDAPIADSQVGDKTAEWIKARLLEQRDDLKEQSRNDARALSFELYRLEQAHLRFIGEKAKYPLLTPADIRDPEGLAVKLRKAVIKGESPDPVSDYIVGRLSPNLKDKLRNFEPARHKGEVLRNQLAKELNRILQTDGLYDEERFKQIALSSQIRDLIKLDPAGKALTELNRLLLKQAYPGEIQ
jgi:hypothetical protein